MFIITKIELILSEKRGKGVILAYLTTIASDILYGSESHNWYPFYGYLRRRAPVAQSVSAPYL